MTIGPFSPGGPHHFLSNFWIEPARGGLTNEHFFQAEKSLDPAERAFVMRSSGPIEAKKRGRMITLRPDWDAVKDQVMLSGLRNKFYLDDTLWRALLLTGTESLVEINHWRDLYWGAEWEQHGRWIGQNRLGELLMQVRAEIQDTVTRVDNDNQS